MNKVNPLIQLPRLRIQHATDEFQKAMKQSQQQVAYHSIEKSHKKLKVYLINKNEEGYQEITALLKSEDVPFISMQSIFHKEAAKKDLYRENDKIHPNLIGQKLIAETIENNIAQAWLIPSKSVNP